MATQSRPDAKAAAVIEETKRARPYSNTETSYLPSSCSRPYTAAIFGTSAAGAAASVPEAATIIMDIRSTLRWRAAGDADQRQERTSAYIEGGP